MVTKAMYLVIPSKAHNAVMEFCPDKVSNIISHSYYQHSMSSLKLLCVLSAEEADKLIFEIKMDEQTNEYKVGSLKKEDFMSHRRTGSGGSLKQYSLSPNIKQGDSTITQCANTISFAGNYLSYTNLKPTRCHQHPHSQA